MWQFAFSEMLSFRIYLFDAEYLYYLLCPSIIRPNNICWFEYNEIKFQYHIKLVSAKGLAHWLVLTLISISKLRRFVEENIFNLTILSMYPPSIAVEFNKNSIKTIITFFVQISFNKKFLIIKIFIFSLKGEIFFHYLQIFLYKKLNNFKGKIISCEPHILQTNNLTKHEDIHFPSGCPRRRCGICVSIPNSVFQMPIEHFTFILKHLHLSFYQPQKRSRLQ